MPYKVRDFARLIPSSSGASVTNSIGHLDDAANLTIFVTSSQAGGSTGASGMQVQISQFDPADSTSVVPSQVSTAYFTISTATLQLSTNGGAFTITNISFRGLRITGLTSQPGNEVIAYVSKQITV